MSFRAAQNRFVCEESAATRCLCCAPALARFLTRLAADRSHRPFRAAAASGVSAGGAVKISQAADTAASSVVFTDLRLFDGVSRALRDGLRVIVEDGRISAVESDSQPLARSMQIFCCGGRVLMPGLIDAHYHVMLASLSMNDLLTADLGYINLAAAGEASRLLLRGFTSIRDLAGPCFGLKRAIDSGLVPGPRIWPCGAMITQTGGHGDYRVPHEIPAARNAPLSHGDAFGLGAIADGEADVLRRAREQLMLGASQLKLAAGGGVTSAYDPIDVSQFIEAEFRAAVAAAENWGTYVTVHAYTPRAINTALRAGVRCVEHGQLMDDECARRMAGEGIWLSTQPFLDDEDALPFPQGSDQWEKQQRVSRGTDATYERAQKHGIRTAWGTDILFDSKLSQRQGAQLAKMARWHEPIDILITATSVNAELLQMAGSRNPYPAPVGVIAPGACADLLLVDGDPLKHVGLLAEPEKNLLVVMKDGRFYKNDLPD
jgi:imidazolonepropionase-like amidohydrolase